VTVPILIDLAPSLRDELWRHLLPRRFRWEEAAFVFAQGEKNEGNFTFRSLEWLPVPPSGFASRSRYHFELTDEARAAVIKRAHDLGASLVEFHSHTSRWAAAFSASDLSGFEEFVPHIFWRLRGRPYAAVVVTRSGIDGLAWLENPLDAGRLEGIIVGPRLLKATNPSSLELDKHGRNQV
jgi:hypothetical protein